MDLPFRLKLWFDGMCRVCMCIHCDSGCRVYIRPTAPYISLYSLGLWVCVGVMGVCPKIWSGEYLKPPPSPIPSLFVSHACTQPAVSNAITGEKEKKKKKKKKNPGNCSGDLHFVSLPASSFCLLFSPIVHSISLTHHNLETSLVQIFFLVIFFYFLFFFPVSA